MSFQGQIWQAASHIWHQREASEHADPFLQVPVHTAVIHFLRHKPEGSEMAKSFRQAVKKAKAPFCKDWCQP